MSNTNNNKTVIASSSQAVAEEKITNMIPFDVMHYTCKAFAAVSPLPRIVTRHPPPSTFPCLRRGRTCPSSRATTAGKSC